MFKQLSKEERFLIDKSFNEEQKSIRQIAKLLKRSPSTISRELKRNLDYGGIYKYKIANYKAKARSWHNHSMYLLKYKDYSEKFHSLYDKRIRGVKNCSKILELTDLNKVSWRQVYNWINSSRWLLRKSDKLRVWYKKGGKRTNGIFSKFNDKRVLPIWVRPKYIDKREEFGHWELDLIIGKKANGFENIVTLTERKTRMLFMTKIKTKNPMKVNSAVYKMIKENNLHIKTITTDNGIEFEKIGLLASWVDCLVYFCEPYASWQKGSNEHINWLVRRFYKKGTDFTNVSDEELIDTQNKINLMDREMFNWASSYENTKKNYHLLNKKMITSKRR